MNLLFFLVVRTLAVWVSAYLLPGITVDSWQTMVVTAIVLGVINAFIKPILQLLTLPLSILSFGLFSLILNAGLILLVGAIVPGFEVADFWSALLFGLVFGVVNGFLEAFR